MAGRALVPESPSGNLHTGVCRDLLIPSFQGKHFRPIPRRQQCSVRNSSGTHPERVVLLLQDPAPPARTPPGQGSLNLADVRVTGECGLADIPHFPQLLFYLKLCKLTLLPALDHRPSAISVRGPHLSLQGSMVNTSGGGLPGSSHNSSPCTGSQHSTENVNKQVRLYFNETLFSEAAV